jgi:hypothetical protein
MQFRFVGRVTYYTITGDYLNSLKVGDESFFVFLIKKKNELTKAKWIACYTRFTRQVVELVDCLIALLAMLIVL